MSVLDRAGADRVYFLGDAVGYVPGSGVADLIVDAGIPAVLGNHEAMLLAGDASNRQIYRLSETLASIGESTLRAIEVWPRSRTVETRGGRCIRMVHGSPSDPTFGYVYPDTDLEPFDLAEGETVVLANTHRPFVRRVGGARVVNVGSCGLPRDCGHLGSVALLDEITDEFRVIRFGIEGATRQMLDRIGDLDPSVKAVFDRRAATCFGEMHVPT